MMNAEICSKVLEQLQKIGIILDGLNDVIPVLVSMLPGDREASCKYQEYKKCHPCKAG